MSASVSELGAGPIRTGLDRALRLSPLQSVFDRRATRERLAVLAYHGIDDPDGFAAHLDYLTAHRTPIDLEELIAVLDGEAEPTPGAVLLTFDDADRTLLEAGLPLLRERDMPGIAFVVAGLLDTDRPYWWKEAAELIVAGGTAGTLAELAPEAAVRRMKRMPDRERRAALRALRRTAPRAASRRPQLKGSELATLEEGGLRVGSHTASHPCLRRCERGTVEREILEAHEILTEALGHEPVAFAYPDGQYDPRAEGVLRRLGYRAAFLFDHRLSQDAPPVPLQISRVRVDASTSLDRLEIILSGLHPALHRMRGGT